jgi:hypothetical protein
MGFITGVITGIAISGAAAAWYLSKSAARVREQYQVERRLGVLGDQLEARTREIQAQVNAQFADLRARSIEVIPDGDPASEIGEIASTASEAAAGVEADIAAAATKTRKLRKALDDATT